MKHSKEAFEELIKASKLKLKNYENKDEFLKALAGVISNIPDDEWTALSLKAQKINNAACLWADKPSKNPKPVIEGFNDGPELKDEEEEEEKPTSRRRSRAEPEPEEEDEDEDATDASAEDEEGEEADTDGEDDMATTATETSGRKKAAPAKKKSAPVTAKKASEKTAAPKKTATEKAPKEKKAGTRQRLALDSKIKVLYKDNPRREGSAVFKAFQKLKSGMTVAEALKVGLKMGNLKKEIKRNNISVG